MRVIQTSNNVASMLAMYDMIRRAPVIEQRGQQVKHVRDFAIVLDARMPPITDFAARKFNLDYAKQEWLWYLRADKMDDSIMEHAKAWQKLKQEDGSFFSNYGQYMFREPGADDSQFEYVVRTLIKDPGSRRASMVILQREHLFEENSDVVCTYGINFSIENNFLEMTVMMRSNDVIFGFTNDAFCFWNLYMFMYAVLRQVVPGLQVGSYTHFTNSMHVYEKHFGMIADIFKDQATTYKAHTVPLPTYEEVKAFLKKEDGDGDDGSYTAWLKAKS